MKHVAVLGDVMLDVWQKTVPTKISAEAPVLVVKHVAYTYSAGGAGNAAVNCAHLGASVSLIGIIGSGNDTGSHELKHALMNNHVSIQALVRSSSWPTIHKLRIVDELGRHLLRVDTEECRGELDPHDVAELYRSLDFAAQKCGVLLVSDYGKGTCTPEVMHYAKRTLMKDCFTVINGKPESVANYAGADVLVFNEAEARVLGFEHEVPKPEDFGVKHLIITCGADGLFWGTDKDCLHLSAPKVEVSDVAGAGDTVCATLAAAGTINQQVLEEAIQNAAAVVSQRGTSVPNKRSI